MARNDEGLRLIKCRCPVGARELTVAGCLEPRPSRHGGWIVFGNSEEPYKGELVTNARFAQLSDRHSGPARRSAVRSLLGTRSVMPDDSRVKDW